MTHHTAGSHDDDSIEAHECGEEEVEFDAFELISDLDALVRAGWLIEVRERGRPSRYALANKARRLAADAHEHELDPSGEMLAEVRDLGAEPCPNCGSPAGYDAGARCRDCRVANLPEGT